MTLHSLRSAALQFLASLFRKYRPAFCHANIDASLEFICCRSVGQASTAQPGIRSGPEILQPIPSAADVLAKMGRQSSSLGRDACPHVGDNAVFQSNGAYHNIKDGVAAK